MPLAAIRPRDAASYVAAASLDLGAPRVRLGPPLRDHTGTTRTAHFPTGTAGTEGLVERNPHGREGSSLSGAMDIWPGCARGVRYARCGSKSQ
jgi:hypothetical protein